MYGYFARFVCMNTHVCMSACMHLCMCVCMYMCVYMNYIYVCICMYMYIIYIYILCTSYMHTDIHLYAIHITYTCAVVRYNAHKRAHAHTYTFITYTFTHTHTLSLSLYLVHKHLRVHMNRTLQVAVSVVFLLTCIANSACMHAKTYLQILSTLHRNGHVKCLRDEAWHLCIVIFTYMDRHVECLSDEEWHFFCILVCFFACMHYYQCICMYINTHLHRFINVVQEQTRKVSERRDMAEKRNAVTIDEAKAIEMENKILQNMKADVDLAAVQTAKQT
jgi:hypothetical protein